MRGLAVGVLDVDTEDVGELPAAQDEEPVEAFAADAADPAFHVRVRVRRPHGPADELDVLALEECVEGARELRVAIVNEKNAPAG